MPIDLKELIPYINSLIGCYALYHTLKMAHRTVKRDEVSELRTQVQDITVKFEQCERERLLYYHENVALMQRLLRDSTLHGVADLPQAPRQT